MRAGEKAPATKHKASSKTTLNMLIFGKYGGIVLMLIVKLNITNLTYKSTIIILLKGASLELESSELHILTIISVLQ